MIDLNGKKFSPVRNSSSGRVSNDAIFIFSHSGSSFSASYSGKGFTDGHLIGNLRSDGSADLVYHSRAETGELEVGKAQAIFSIDLAKKVTIEMNWQWLNASEKSGQSYYEEV